MEKTIFNIITDNVSEIIRIQEILGVTPVIIINYFWRDTLSYVVFAIPFGILIMCLLRQLRVIKCDWFFCLKRGGIK